MIGNQISSVIDIDTIAEILPHRYPFLLVDRIIAHEQGKSLRAIKNVTINEPFFLGHFPQKPIMPGVLIIEAMAQATALLGYFSFKVKTNKGKLYYLVGVDNARFRRPVGPGDQLLIDVEFITLKRGIWKFSARALVGDVLVASAKLMTTVTDSSP